MKKFFSKNKVRKTISRHQFSFLEKRMTIRFIVASKFHYGPINTPNVIAYFIGLRNTTSLINPYFLISQLRKTLSLVYLNSYHRGLTIMSGIFPSKIYK